MNSVLIVKKEKKEKMLLIRRESCRPSVVRLVMSCAGKQSDRVMK